MDDVRKCERLQTLKREVGRGKGRWILVWGGHSAETKGWTEWEGKEGMEKWMMSGKGSESKDGGNNSG